MTKRVQDTPTFAGHSPDQERPLGGYATLMALFAVLTAGFAAWFRGSSRTLPDRIAAPDLALITVATHKASRLVTKERSTSVLRAPFTRFEGDSGQGEVEEAARGRGLRRATGELLVCPYCLSVWIVALFIGGLLVTPRATRWVAAAFTALFGADALQIAYKRAERTL